jgi:hypothetical protein
MNLAMHPSHPQQRSATLCIKGEGWGAGEVLCKLTGVGEGLPIEYGATGDPRTENVPSFVPLLLLGEAGSRRGRYPRGLGEAGRSVVAGKRVPGTHTWRLVE